MGIGKHGLWKAVLSAVAGSVCLLTVEAVLCNIDNKILETAWTVDRFSSEVVGTVRCDLEQVLCTADCACAPRARLDLSRVESCHMRVFK